MGKFKSGGNDSSNLRKKAEKEYLSRAKDGRVSSLTEVEHELNVHKIELEMQNDELHQTQVKLLRSNENYNELFDKAPVGYFILDREGVIIKANSIGCRNFKIDKISIINKPFSTFLNLKVCQDDYYKHRNLVAETEETQKCECDIRRNDGTVYSAMIETSMMNNPDGSFKYFLSMVSDISDRRIQERKIESALVLETELNEMKSQFIAIASHEFRTPLASILLSADLIERYSDPKDEEKRQKHFTRIKSSVTRLKDILGDFLSMSHIEKGLTINNPSKFNLDDFLEEFVDETRMLNVDHTIKYKLKGEQTDVYLDKKLLRICLTNLMGNAIKFSATGGVIDLTATSGPFGKLKIVIKDHGVGIPENDQSHIFEQFFRAKNVDAIQGIGLGLNITRKIVSIMGGLITFESIENIGTTFFLSFPKD